MAILAHENRTKNDGWQCAKLEAGLRVCHEIVTAIAKQNLAI